MDQKGWHARPKEGASAVSLTQIKFIVHPGLRLVFKDEPLTSWWTSLHEFVCLICLLLKDESRAQRRGGAWIKSSQMLVGPKTRMWILGNAARRSAFTSWRRRTKAGQQTGFGCKTWRFCRKSFRSFSSRAPLSLQEQQPDDTGTFWDEPLENGNVASVHQLSTAEETRACSVRRSSALLLAEYFPVCVQSLERFYSFCWQRDSFPLRSRN